MHFLTGSPTGSEDTPATWRKVPSLLPPRTAVKDATAPQSSQQMSAVPAPGQTPKPSARRVVICETPTPRPHPPPPSESRSPSSRSQVRHLLSFIPILTKPREGNGTLFYKQNLLSFRSARKRRALPWNIQVSTLPAMSTEYQKYHRVPCVSWLCCNRNCSHNQG